MCLFHIGKVLRLSRNVKGYNLCVYNPMWERHRSSTQVNFADENERIQNLCKILDIPPESAKRLVMKKTFVNESAGKVLAVLEKFGFGRAAIMEYPGFLTMAPSAVENYIMTMRETGFYSIRPSMIVGYRNINNRSILALRETNVIPNQHTIITNYCKVLELTPASEEKLWSLLPVRTDQLTLKELRIAVMTHYAMEILGTTASNSEKIIKIYPRTQNRCFTWVKQVLQMLLNDLEFPKQTICKHGYLLQGNPENIRNIVSRIPNLSDLPLKQVAHHRPKILMSSCSSLLEIESLFHEHEILPQSIQKYLEIYTLSPTTLRQRLNELKTIPEFTALRSHPRVARLLYYQNKIKSRLHYLNSIKMSGVSLHHLSTDGKRFSNFLEVGDLKTKGLDVIHFLSDHFDKRIPEVRNNLKLQPHWLQVSLLAIRESLLFLESMKVFTKSQIFNNLTIILYPKDKIETEIGKVIESKEATFEDDFFLSMVLYLLERPVHFTGDGLWHNRTDTEEETQDSLIQDIGYTEKIDTNNKAEMSCDELNPLNQSSH